MATLKEIVYNIKNIKFGGLQSGDNKLSDRQVAFIVDYVRANLLKKDQEEELAKGNIDLFQTLSPIELVKVDKADACDALVGCTILRSKDKIPSYLRMGSISTLTNKPIPRTTFNKAYWEQYSKFAGIGIRTYMKDDYVYVEGNNRLKYLKVRAIFESPQAVQECNIDLCKEKKDPLEFEYPLPLHLLRRLTEIIRTGEMSDFVSHIQLEDTANNTNQEA